VGNLILRAITAIQLTRLTLAFGAISEIWLVILLSRADERAALLDVATMPLGWALLLGAVIAVGLFAHGTALNDILDVRHDAAFSPERPIPAGRIRVGQAAVLASATLIISILAAAGFGIWSVCVALLAAAAVLFFNTVGKFIPAIGLTTVGFIHAAHMLIPNWQLWFLLPVWLSLSHAMAIAAMVHVYEAKRPRLSRRSMIAAMGGWLMWTAIIVSWSEIHTGGVWPAGISPLNALYPLLAVLGFVIIARWKTSNVSGRAAAEKLKRYGAMWQSLYAAAWLLAMDLELDALWMGIFALAGFTAMTAIREVTGLTGRPIMYR